MMTKVAVVGATGRMGRTLVRCIHPASDFELAAALESASHNDIGKDAGNVADIGPIGVLISGGTESIAAADVIIDFSAHTAVPKTMAAAISLNKPVVLGTTGLDDREKGCVQEAASTLAVVWAPNMSLGVNLLFSLAEKAATALGENYAMEIDETHHLHKKDAPSGTALRLGEVVTHARNLDFRSIYVHDAEGKQSAPNPEKLVIRSHREGEVIGDHTISFKSDAEVLELTHHAWTRDAFAKGALHAAKWVRQQPPGLYDMKAVLGL